ncbi:MAG: sensor histidine kinase [Gemmatimonadaceae bacterium]
MNWPIVDPRPSTFARPRFWLLYAAAWTPLAILYAVLIAQRGAPPAVAASSGFATALSAAVLGVGVHWVAGRVGGPEHGRVRLLTLHALLAVAYSTAWSASILAMISVDAPESVRADYVRYSMGWQFVSGLMVYGVIAGVSTAARAWERLREQEQAAARSEALRVRAELEALRAQLDPHFIFNTLHSLMALVRSDQRAAEDAVERFGDLLRYVLDVNRERRDEAPLADEWAFVRSYLALERLRLGPRLSVSEDVDPDLLDCRVPTFALQPLVENAIRHAIAPRARGGTLTLVARADGDDRIVLEVRDDGPGTTREHALSANGVGLRVLRQRLDVLYRGAGRLEITTAPGEGFAAAIVLPLRTSPQPSAIGHPPAAGGDSTGTRPQLSARAP